MGILLQNCAEQIFDIVLGLTIAKLGRGDILKCDFFFQYWGKEVLEIAPIFLSKNKGMHLF